MTELFWEIFVGFSFFYFICINLQYTILVCLSIFAARSRVNEAEITDFEILKSSQFTPPVSIVIAAYNEEEVILDCVHAALGVDYPESEVIVVNDRSRDRTLRSLIQEFDLYVSDQYYQKEIPTSAVRRIYRSESHPSLIVVDKEHGGKADSLNVGVNVAQYPYVCNTDADTIFEEDSILRIMRPVSRDPDRVVAIGGQVRVGNGFRVEDGEIIQRRLPRSLLPTLQLVEYLRTFIANRVGWSVINGMMLISGAFGMWKRDVLTSIGGFSTETTAEDVEITMRIHRILRLRGEDFKVVSLPDPVCWTQVPEDPYSLMKQRNRWRRTVLEAVNIHRDMLLNPFYGTAGLLAMPSYFFFEILGPFLEVFSYFFVISAYYAGYVNLATLGTFLLISIGYTTFLNTAAILIEDYYYGTYNLAETLELLLTGLLDNLGYRQFTMAVRVWATFDWLGNIKGWGNIRRFGFQGDEAEPSTEPEVKQREKEAATDSLFEARNWDYPDEIRGKTGGKKYLGRVAVLCLITIVGYFIFVQGTHYLFTPNLTIAGHNNPEKVVTVDNTVRVALDVRNTRFISTGAGFVVGVINGDTEVEGPVIEVPPRETRSVFVDLPLEPGKQVYSLVLFDAWRDNKRVDSRPGLTIDVDTRPLQLPAQNNPEPNEILLPGL